MTDNWCAVDATALSIIGPSSGKRRVDQRAPRPPAVHNTPPSVCTVNDLRRTLTTLERWVWFTRVSCSPQPTRGDDSGMCRPASRCATKQHVHSDETITSNDVNSHLIYTARANRCTTSTDGRNIDLNETTAWDIYASLLPLTAYYSNTLTYCCTKLLRTIYYGVRQSKTCHSSFLVHKGFQI